MQKQENSDASAFLAINDHLQNFFDSIGAQDNRALLCLVMANIWMRLDLLEKGDIYEVLTRSQDLAKAMAEIKNRGCKISDIVISHSTS